MRRSLLTIPAVSIGSSVAFNAYADSGVPALSDYQPMFFEDSQWQFILAATDRLIPRDEHGPGALEAHVPVFIDKELAGSYGRADDWYMEGPFHVDADEALGYQLPHTPADIYRLGIRATNDYCRQRFDRDFTALSRDDQETVLRALEKGTPDFARLGVQDLPSKTFFSFLLQNTKEGFLADPIYGGNRHMVGWKLLGFTGARASFREWVDQYDRDYPLGPVSLSGERG
ncbi:gluconate 2-dehydrogenase subunit 3 family protein [Kushneria avicenniae]|nr:gluconate 2-dehydrogenase subunit 3 family protein [Kushneria avicenniae]